MITLYIWFPGSMAGSTSFSTSRIKDQELATWLNGIHAGYTTYVFNQCYSGGMLRDDLN